MRPLSSQWIPTKLTSIPTSPYLTPVSVSTPLQLFLRSPSTAFLSFSEHVSSLNAKFFPSSQGLTLYLCFLVGPSKESFALLYKAFLRPLFTLPWMVSFPERYQYHQIETPPPSSYPAISGCLSSSPIPVFLFEASLPPL